MKKLALLLGIAALAAAIWVIVASVGVDPVPTGMVREAGSGVESVSGAVAEEGATEQAPVERSEMEGPEPSSAETTRLVQVLVTNKESGAPIPGAEVAWYEGFSTRDLTPEESEEYARLGRDPELAAHRYGTTVLADERGEVFIPVERYVRTTGRHGELYGELIIQPDVEEESGTQYKLELERDSSLVVQVLDSLGSPAVGIPIGLQPEWGDERDRYGRLPVAVSEAPDGFAAVPHLQIKLRGWENQKPPPTRYFLRAMIPGLIEKGELTDPTDPPEDPLILRLPPMGRVVTRVTDIDGRMLGPELVRGGVTLFIQPEARPSGERVRAPASEQWHSPPVENGIHVFDRVVAGQIYVARSRAGGEDVEEAFQGPLAEGQEVSVTLSLESDLYFLVGRAIDEDREPLRNAPLSLSFSFVGSNGGGSNFVFQTDERGHFKVNVPVGARGVEVALDRFAIEEDRSRLPRGTSPEGPITMYSWRGEMPFLPGENDLGDVMLDGGVVVASGRILVNKEAPVQDRFSLTLQGRQFVGERGERWGGDEGLQWNDVGGGRFEIRGVPESNRYRLIMRDQTYLPVRPLEFVPGTTGLEINLSTGGSLRAEVLGDEEVPLHGLQLRLIPTEGQDQILSQEPDVARYMRTPFGDRTLARLDGQEGGRHEFRWDSLWAGGYRLEVGVRGGRPLLEVPAIHIAEGEQTEDPRLNGIDLRGKLRSIVVRLRDQDGGPIPDAEYGPGIVLIMSADGESQGFTPQVGNVAIITGEPFLNLLVAAQGYKPEELPAVTSDTTVNLERFPDVTVRILGGAPDLPDNHSLRVTVSEIGRERDERRYTTEYQPGRRVDDWLRPPASRRAVEENGEVRVQVRGAGDYRVRARVQNDDTRGSGSISDTEPATVHLTGSGFEVIELEIPGEALRRAVEQAGRR